MSIAPRTDRTGWLEGIQEAAELLRSVEASEAVTVNDGIATLLKSVHRWLDVEALSIVLYKGETEHLELAAVSGAAFSAEDRRQESHRTGQHITGAVFSSGKAEYVNNVAADPRCDHRMLGFWRERLPSGTLRSAALVPFSAELECRGVFRAYNRLENGTPTDFVDSDLEVLAVVGHVVSGIVDLLWERNNVANINATIAPLASKTDLGKTAQTIVHVATRLSNSPAAVLYIVEPFDQDHLRLAGITGFHRRHEELNHFRLHGSLSGEVVLSGKSQVIANLKEARVANPTVGNEEHFVSAVLVPTPARQLKGCLVVFSRERRDYHRSTVQALENLGLLAASILDARAQSETMAELTLHLANAGHSARTPAQRVSNALDKIRDIAKRDRFWPRVESQVTAAFDEMELLDRRLDSWLLVSKDSMAAMGLQRQLRPVAPILHRSTKRLGSEAADRSVDVVIDASIEQLPAVMIDVDKMELAFDNLLENAIKYSWRDRTVDIRGTATAHTVCISVTDHGLGIPEALYESIFDPTTRSPIRDRQRYIPGTGLGLQIVKNIVDAHHGSIRVESRPFLNDPLRVANYEGFTTTFWVVLQRE